MPKWHVIALVQVRRKYEVEAADVNGAIMVAYRASPIDEVDVREEVVSVYEIENENAEHP